jgi:hypothetical protein
MRECFRNTGGRAFFALLCATLAGLFAAPFLIEGKGPLLGFVPLPFAVGLVLVGVWLPAYLIYFKRYWPFR